MRLLTLYLRARGVPVALCAILGATLGFWALDSPDPRLLVLTIGFGVGAAAGGLGGHDIDLDRSAALAWPPRRALHLAGIAAGTAGAALATDLGLTEIIARDSVGLTGLAAIGAAAFGRQLAWSLPVTWTIFSPTFPTDDEVINWMQQPPSTAAANITAAALGIAGLAAYTALGPRASS